VDEAQGRIKKAKTAWNKFPQRRQGVHQTVPHTSAIPNRNRVLPQMTRALLSPASPRIVQKS
jgi:hypothetical protein